MSVRPNCRRNKVIHAQNMAHGEGKMGQGSPCTYSWHEDYIFRSQARGITTCQGGTQEPLNTRFLQKLLARQVLLSGDWNVMGKLRGRWWNPGKSAVKTFTSWCYWRRGARWLPGERGIEASDKEMNMFHHQDKEVLVNCFYQGQEHGCASLTGQGTWGRELSQQLGEKTWLKD